MARNYVQEGNILMVTMASATPAGTLVKFGTLFGVALNDVAEGAAGPVRFGGVWDLPCALTGEVSAGDSLYYVAASGKLTDASSGNTLAGVAVDGAAASDTTIRVRL